jgi:hypothetical protein
VPETSLERVKRLLSRVTYKPGWKITADYQGFSLEQAHMGPWKRVEIMVQFKGPDAYDPRGKETMICRSDSLQEYDIEHLSDREVVEYFICRAIRELEEHEFREWFKFDEVRVFDPHPELKEAKHVEPTTKGV